MGGAQSGAPSEAWLAASLVYADLPFSLPIAWDTGRWADRARVHRLVRPFFVAAWEAVADAGLRASVVSWGGAYNHRAKRSDRYSLSMHAYGIAFDINPRESGMGRTGTIDPALIDVFEFHGWYWGGRFRPTPDEMHFQFAEGV
jgi:hypothetical protein